MGRRSKAFIFLISLLTITTGCSVAVPNVTSLISNFNAFRLTGHSVHIDNLSDLSNIPVGATCDVTNTSFEYEIPAQATGWLPLPASSGGPFASITNNCSSGSTLSFTLDLSSTAPFSTMSLGDSYQINFREVNLLGIGTTETFQITYSILTVAKDSLINGQGYNQTLTGTTGTYSLSGKVTNIPKLEVSTSGIYTLQGKVHFQ